MSHPAGDWYTHPDGQEHPEPPPLNIEPYIRPSSTQENADCPARPRIQARVVELIGMPMDAPEANLGTSAHRWGACGVRLLVQDENWELMTEVYPIDSAIAQLREAHQCEDPDRRLDSWTWRCVEAYVRFVHSMIVKHDIKPENVLIEEKIDMADLGFVNAGTSDVTLIVPFKLVIVIDAKMGFVDQGEAFDHAQLAAYGCAAATKFKAESAEVWIAQPRATEKANRFTGATFDMAKLADAVAWIQSVNAACREPDPELRPGYTQCVNCKALRLCPGAEEYIVKTLKAYELIGAPATPEAWGNLIGAAKLAEKRAEGVKDLGKAHLQAGGAVNGFKLGNPRSLRAVTQVPAALQRLEAAGMGQEAAEAISMSLTKLSDAAEQVIADLITEKLSDPPLVATKSKAGVL